MTGNIAALVGMFLAVITVKWIARVLYSFGIVDFYFFSTPDTASRSAGYAALLINPAPWLLCIGAYLLVLWAKSQSDVWLRSIGISWSIGAFSAVSALTLYAAHRQAQRRLNGTGSGRSVDNNVS